MTRMIAADVLKLRKRLGTMIWALVLTLGTEIAFFGVRALQHSSNSLSHPPAGAKEGFRGGVVLLALFLGPLAAVLIGTEAGAGDSAAGVFRDLVITGRSRAALFTSRTLGALIVTLAVTTIAFAFTTACTYLFAGGLPTPTAATVVWAYLFTLLSNGLVCAVAVGLASLLDSRPPAIIALIGWQLVVAPILVSIHSLGSVREVLLDAPLLHINPVRAAGSETVAMSLAAIVITMLLWPAIFLAAGLWRTNRMDA